MGIMEGKNLIRKEKKELGRETEKMLSGPGKMTMPGVAQRVDGPQGAVCKCLPI